MWEALFCYFVVVIGGSVLKVSETLELGVMLGVVSCLVSVLIGCSSSSLIGYSIFLVYSGGLIVLVGYVLSACPNEQVPGNIMPFLSGAGVFLLLFWSGWGTINSGSLVIWSVMDNENSGNIVLFIGALLFYVLLVVSSICEKRSASLRSGI